MKKLLKFLRWTVFIILLLCLGVIGYLRFNRTLDRQIYRADYKDEEIESEFDFREMYLSLEDGTKIHSAIFTPPGDSAAKATIIHHAGNGMNLNDSQKRFYAPLLNAGYQIFTYERRGYGKSTGEANNSHTLGRDANEIFDQVLEFDEVKGSKLIIWGTSIGGIFATTNAASKNDQIDGLIIESAFSSFPKIGQHYASEVNLENFKFLIPLILNNDFPTDQRIRKVTKPVVIIHSVDDDKIPFKFAEEIYANSNKATTEFWEIDGPHVRGIINYAEDYVARFDNMIGD